MSTTTVSVRSTTRAARIDEVRRREAEARDAARRAAQRAAQAREDLCREMEAREAARRRTDAANRVIGEQEDRFQQLIARLDEAARRLPDLSLTAPALQSLRHEAAADAAQLEAYAVRLTAEVADFSLQLDRAITEGERLLARRVARAAAWREAADLEQQAALRAQANQELASRLQVPLVSVLLPPRPGADVELESVESHVAALRKVLDEFNRQHASLIARDETRARAIDLAGTPTRARSAAEAQARHASERRTAAQAALRRTRDKALSTTGLRLEDLPDALQWLIDDALAQAHTVDRDEQITRWIVREKQRRDGVERALSLLQSAPDLVHELPQLSQRWTNLLACLQRIAGGLEEFTPSLEREYEQIQADARRNANSALTRADWLQAMSAQGFEVLEREDDRSLVVVDLDHPEVWLEATELESEQGGFSAVLELKTDANSSPDDDAAITSDVCSRLTRVAGTATDSVQTQAEVIEHKPRITRGRRPAKARKTFAQGL
jgi:hypothetical protein